VLSQLSKISIPQNESAKLLKAKTLYITGQYSEIESVLAGVNTLDADGRLALATGYHENERFEEARTLWKTLITEQDADVIYSNVGATFYYTSVTDSALYYAKQALALKPYDERYLFALGLIYSGNDESDKACAHYFLSSKLGSTDGAEYYVSENCPSWQKQWLVYVPGEHLTQVSNMFPNNNESVLAINEHYIFEEAGVQKQIKLLDMNRTPVGIVFTLQSEGAEVMHRWCEFEKPCDWCVLVPGQTRKY